MKQVITVVSEKDERFEVKIVRTDRNGNPTEREHTMLAEGVRIEIENY